MLNPSKLMPYNSSQDYYAFGMLQPVRNYNTSDHRFGFNGKEKDDEVKGSGNSYDYGARIYDPRLGRFLSADPLKKKFPMLTPYQFASNSPISGVDLDGLEYYYAANGNFIGVGNPQIKEAKFVLTETTASQVQKMTNDQRADFAKNGYSRDVISLPSKPLVEKVESFYTSSTEKGMVVGKDQNGNTKESQTLSQGSAEHIDVGKGYTELNEQNITPIFDIHSHPDPGQTEPGETKSNFIPSPKDKNSSTLNTEANWLIGWENSTPPKPQISTGDDDILSKPRKTQKITFYDKSGRIATFDFKNFKKAVGDANEDFKKRTGN